MKTPDLPVSHPATGAPDRGTGQPQSHAGMKYRATLDDGDTTRERALTIHSNTLKDVREWADLVLAKAKNGGVVNVYMTVEQHIEMIPKPRKETPK